MSRQPSFSAALLSGGKSTRMGRDKALLTLEGSNVALWQRQWNVLEELQPGEIFWSGTPRAGLPEGALVVLDSVENAGPLAGISACLEVVRTDLLVVLAVDLPGMNAGFLRGLIGRCTENCGAVAHHDDFFEPLAAVYPRGLGGLAREHLAQGRLAMQDFIRAGIGRKAMKAVALEGETVGLFRNVNSPADFVGEG
jgi:molybdopterin-guanine dinucleotide biosynthesis protein A